MDGRDSSQMRLPAFITRSRGHSSLTSGDHRACLLLNLEICLILATL